MKSHWLLRLYPRVWRDRYGDEFLSLLESRPLGATQIIDIVRSSFSEHLRGGVDLGRVGANVRTVLGYFFVGHILWVGIASIGGDGPGAQAWTMDALLLSALLQARFAMITLTVVFAMGKVIDRCPVRTRIGIADWLGFWTLLAVITTDRLVYLWLGVRPSPGVIEATFGEPGGLGPGFATWFFVAEWAIRPLRLRYRALA